MRSTTPNVPPASMVPNDDDDDEDRELPIKRTQSAKSVLFGQGSGQSAIPRNAFGREDEITSDFKLGTEPDPRVRPRASQPPAKSTEGSPTQPWQPLIDEEIRSPCRRLGSDV
jgi:hypothetical protein